MWTGAVLTGGASRRMGRDKALLDVGGRPLVAVAAAALRGAGAGRVLAIGGDLEALARLGLDPVPDEHPGEGPLGGILTAFSAASTDVVVVLACDLPAASATSVRAVVHALERRAGAAVAWPEVGGHAQVLHAAWRVGVAGPVLRAAFLAGERAPRRAAAPLDRVAVRALDAETVRDADRPGDLPAAGPGAVPGGPTATMA